jgi:superfamily II DNA or RNA helicase
MTTDDIYETERRERCEPSTPFTIQEELLVKMEEHYETHDRGYISWTCGLGKTKVPLFFCKRQGLYKVCIGVPTTNLIEQVKEEIKSIFRDVPYFILSLSDPPVWTSIQSFLRQKGFCFVKIFAFSRPVLLVFGVLGFSLF